MAYDQATPQDEGYSEDPYSVATMSGPSDLQSWVQSLPVSQRTEYVMGIIDQLPTSQVCEIVRRVRPRLYINFFQSLPQEVILKILGFLDPQSLINTARASREWSYLALDRKLWEQLYYLEGFRVIRSEIQKFEQQANLEPSRSGASDRGDGEPSRKRRATPQRILPTLGWDGDSEMMDADVPVVKQSSVFGSTSKGKMPMQRDDTDEVMAESPKALPASPNSTTYSARLAKMQLSGSSTQSDHLTSPGMSKLLIVDRSDGRKKLNWQYLYSQRRRLEANWENEKYTNIQLPHPDFRQEAHRECIYTIQHSGKYLVSGSRDKTLRIWNLDTRRLVRQPLAAHTGSVLCLQFDADPSEDLIVSGSSDATVILWRFSTGQIIQRLRKAHRESVLNVRFDKRVLVTCSKDKTIKIFNRQPLHPGQTGYPDLMHAVHPVPTYLNNYGFNPAPTAGIPIKQPYSMIGSLEGHGAAVNAVQIYGDEVVSASGDRTVKIWNWPAQQCLRTLVGHTKGIACVQYDGRRVVSGSSDNEVKVFDKTSGLEVASLRAHTSLVRTVQAGFGDLPYSEAEDEEIAKATDLEYFKALDRGDVTQSGQMKGRPRNAGSRKPEDITAYGAKLPPGGGGGKFGRIVSGSYDESIIIWRRDKEGVWRAQHTLRQEDGGGGRVRRPAQALPPAAAAPAVAPPNAANTAPAPTPAPTPAPVSSTTSSVPPQLPDVNAPTIPFAPGSKAYWNHIIDSAIASAPHQLRHVLQTHPQLLQSEHLKEAVEALPVNVRAVYAAEINTVTDGINQQQSAANQPGGSGDSADVMNTPGPSAQNTQAAQQPAASTSSGPQTITQGPIVQPPTAIQQPPATQAAPPVNAPAQAAGVAPVPVPNVAHTHHHGNMARVFKLQFDARRIICCSQTTVIVGWDFANGDEQILEASRFFAPIE